MADLRRPGGPGPSAPRSPFARLPGRAASFEAAVAAHRAGRLDEAEAVYRALLKAQPKHVDALNLLGALSLQRGAHAEAVKLIGKAIRIGPSPAHPTLHSNLAMAQRKLGQFEDALASIDRALALDPQFAEGHYNRGLILRDLDRLDEALASLDRAIALRPNYVDAIVNRGGVLQLRKRHEEALACFDRALAIDARALPALSNRTYSLYALGRTEEALASSNRALAIKANDVDALRNRGVVLRNLRRLPEAIACFDRVLSLEPNNVEALEQRAQTLVVARRPDEAARDFAHLLSIDPAYPYARGQLLHARMLVCDWTDFDELVSAIDQHVGMGRSDAEPFGYQGYALSESLLRSAAEIWVREKIPSQGAFRSLASLGIPSSNDRIRIGYLCGEFRQQATSILMTELIERWPAP